MTYSQHAFDGEPPIAYRLDEPAKLIAALPAVLGFVPEKSLVLVNIDHGEMGAVMRVDLGDDMVGTIAHLARVAAASGTDAVVAVIVDADQAGCEACADEFRLIAEQLAEHLTRHGVSLIGSHVVDRVAAGGRWHCADLCGAGGEVADPFASPLAAAAVLEGRPLYGCRSDLVAVIAVDPARRRRVAAAITRRLKEGTVSSADRVEAIVAAARCLGDGGDLSDDTLAGAALALADVIVRDTVFALAVSDGAGDAEMLWATLARALPRRWRTDVLVLLAFSAYVRGDGPLAGVSLEAALRACPEHRMAGMLDRALQAGMRPEQIRELAATGYRLADELGVELPPRRMFGREC